MWIFSWVNCPLLLRKLLHSWEFWLVSPYMWPFCFMPNAFFAPLCSLQSAFIYFLWEWWFMYSSRHHYVSLSFSLSWLNTLLCQFHFMIKKAWTWGSMAENHRHIRPRLSTKLTQVPNHPTHLRKKAFPYFRLLSQKMENNLLVSLSVF